MNLPMGDVYRGIPPQITLAVNTRKVLLYVSKEKYGKSKKRTKNFARKIVNVASPTTGRRFRT